MQQLSLEEIGTRQFDERLTGAVYYAVALLLPLLAAHGILEVRGFFFLGYLPTINLPPIAVRRVGKVPVGKEKRYWKLFQEKPRRMVEHPGHISSWQSRDEDVDHWGGAVAADLEPLAASFSGIPDELADEALAACVMNELGWMSHGRVQEIMRTSNNPYLRKLFVTSE